MDNYHFLKRFGLTDLEGKIYVCLVNQGPSLISNIAKSAQIHRPAVYRALTSLQAKNLVSSVQRSKRNYYVAESPARLKETFEQNKNLLESALADLTSAYERRKTRPTVKFFEGKKGIQMVLEDLVSTLDREGVYYRFSSHKSALALEKYLPKDFRQRRETKNLQRYMVTDKLTEWQETPKLNRAHKLLPSGAGLFKENIAELIYNDKTAIVDFDSESVVLIQNKTIADFQRRIFKTLYELL
ncbi:MAG: hypothetical protein HYT43_00290 [Candidatus Taylorbacteria bacterium]|nr:hypothetical protein [Candidatus Taylorbacteria bacterium]